MSQLTGGMFSLHVSKLRVSWRTWRELTMTGCLCSHERLPSPRPLRPEDSAIFSFGEHGGLELLCLNVWRRTRTSSLIFSLFKILFNTLK